MLVLTGAPAAARAADPTSPSGRRDELGFVELLLQLGLADEAGREARRLMVLRGADVLPAQTAFRVGMALALAGDAERAVPFLTQASATTSEPADADKWQLAAGVALLRAQAFPHALHLFARVEAFGTDAVMRERAARLGCIGAVLARDAAAARGCVQRFASPSDAGEMRKELATLEINPGTRAIVGGILSGIVPGLGQVTAGKVGNGLVALALNSATVTATILLLADGAVLDGTLFGLGVGLRYYMGNINNGANAWRGVAERRRDQATRSLLLRLREGK